MNPRDWKIRDRKKWNVTDRIFDVLLRMTRQGGNQEDALRITLAKDEHQLWHSGTNSG
jgi:hypothetical protein